MSALVVAALKRDNKNLRFHLRVARDEVEDLKRNWRNLRNRLGGMNWRQRARCDLMEEMRVFYDEN